MSGWHLLDDAGRLRGLAVLNIIPKDGVAPGPARSSTACSMASTLTLWHAAVTALTGELASQGADLAQAYASTPWTAEALRRSGYTTRFSVKFHIRDRQGLIPQRCDLPPHAAGGGLCLYVGPASSAGNGLRPHDQLPRVAPLVSAAGGASLHATVVEDRPAAAEVLGLVRGVMRVAEVDQVEVDALDLGPAQVGAAEVGLADLLGRP